MRLDALWPLAFPLAPPAPVSPLYVEPAIDAA